MTTASKIIVGVDGSEHSGRAVQWCADHAAALDAEVVAVHALDLPTYIGPGMAPYPTSPLTPAQRNEIKDAVTHEWCKPLANAGVAYRGLVMEGDPALALMEAAKAEQAELVVTGRRGRGGFAELILGSTSHALTHHLDRPLVIVP